MKITDNRQMYLHKYTKTKGEKIYYFLIILTAEGIKSLWCRNAKDQQYRFDSLMQAHYYNPLREDISASQLQTIDRLASLQIKRKVEYLRTRKKSAA